MHCKISAYFQISSSYFTHAVKMLTLIAPKNHSVVSSPTEKINRKIVEIKNVLMAAGFTPTIVTRAREPNMAVQIKPDSLGSSSAKQID
jgi:hypothetical protein